MWSLWHWPKVITLRGLHCFENTLSSHSTCAVVLTLWERSIQHPEQVWLHFFCLNGRQETIKVVFTISALQGVGCQSSFKDFLSHSQNRQSWLQSCKRDKSLLTQTLFRWDGIGVEYPLLESQIQIQYLTKNGRWRCTSKIWFFELIFVKINRTSVEQDSNPQPPWLIKAA